jgi:hypothetical protein
MYPDKPNFVNLFLGEVFLDNSRNAISLVISELKTSKLSNEYGS